MVHAFPWLPLGVEVPGGARIGRLEEEGPAYQIVRAGGGSEFILLACSASGFARQVCNVANHLNRGDRLGELELGGDRYLAVTFSSEFRPIRVGDIPRRATPPSAKELLELAQSIGNMRERSPESSWFGAVYLPEFFSCISIEEPSSTPQDRLGLAIGLLTGGVEDPKMSISQICTINPWVTNEEARKFLGLLGFEGLTKGSERLYEARPPDEFVLPGRPSLQEFFREYVIDLFWRKDKYDALGVKIPGGILLHGPPGTGKSFAVRKLADFLGWPVFDINMGQIGSPYIHQTSVMIRGLFESAFESAPSLILIDEVDAFVGDRERVGQDHKVEEISEFLRLIETASEQGVIVVATTNRKGSIDDAMKRRGRFDHIVEVGYPDADEIASVLRELLNERPHVGGLNLDALAMKLSSRPMSDIAWVVNEGARIAVKSNKDRVDDISLFQAINRLPGV